MERRIYRIKEVSEITGLKPPTLYKLIRLQQFPSGIKLTSRSTGWLSDTVQAWLDSRIQAEGQ